MTNIDRAAEVLIHWADSEGGLSAIDRDYDGDLTGGAEALADAGLLAPDLPEAAEEEGHIYFGDDGKTYALPDGQVYILDYGVWRPTKPAVLRADAAALLAAANYAERNHHE